MKTAMFRICCLLLAFSFYHVDCNKIKKRQTDCEQINECVRPIENSLVKGWSTIPVDLIDVNSYNTHCGVVARWTECVADGEASCSRNATIREVKKLLYNEQFYCTPYGRKEILGLEGTDCSRKDQMDINIGLLNCAGAFNSAASDFLDGNPFDRAYLCRLVQVWNNCARTGTIARCGYSYYSYISSAVGYHQRALLGNQC